MGWQERIDPTESQRFEGYAQELRAIQERVAKGRPDTRALHTKAHVGLVGELHVRAVPEVLRAGVFARPRVFPVYVRFSNGAPGRAPDGRPDLRGVGLKLVGVEGPKIIPGLETALTQDFLFIQIPATPVRDPDEFMKLLRASRKGPALLVPRLIAAVGFRRALAIVRGALKIPKVRSLATARFYTAVPLRIGAEAVKLALLPAETEVARRGPKGPNALREDLVARVGQGSLRFSLCAQRFSDEATTPIEDASVVWPESTSPQLPLAELVIPRQDVTTPRGVEIEALLERLSFDPWHALPEHRPLGAVMRARAPAYRESVLGRNGAPEPSEVLSFS